MSFIRRPSKGEQEGQDLGRVAGVKAARVNCSFNSASLSCSLHGDTCDVLMLLFEVMDRGVELVQ